MESYRTRLTLRLVWWWTWWAVCAFMFFGNLLDLILVIVDDAFISHQSPNVIYVIAKVVALAIFVIPTFAFFPSIDRLLSKDIKNEKVQLYAKSIMLERKLHKKNKANETRKKDEQIKDEIKSMEQQLENNGHE